MNLAKKSDLTMGGRVDEICMVKKITIEPLSAAWTHRFTVVIQTYFRKPHF